MKIFGKKIEGPNKEVIIIPRPDGDIILEAVAIMSFEKFEQMVPKPVPPKVRRKGGMGDDLQAASFKLATEQYGKRKWYYIFLFSLKDSPGLEWETIDYDKPDTWGNFEKELKDAGFNEREINIIQEGVARANTIDETKVEEARQRFLLLQEEQRLAELSLKDEPKDTPSGEPAKDLALSPQT